MDVSTYAAGAVPPRTSRSGRCDACGVDGPLAVVAYPQPARAGIGLCVVCAHDASRLRALVRALGADAITITDQEQEVER